MRSAKQRSRSKSNRPKSLGNIINRVFDSSGPEGKVRGTPQQIIDKYLVLARDAQLSNDRVAAENFQQHAEHYTRLLAQAQREQQTEAEARRLQQEERNRQQQEERNRQQQRRQEDGRQTQGNDARSPVDHDGPPQQELSSQQSADALTVRDEDSDSDSALVETPEARRDAAAQASAGADSDATEQKPAPRRKRAARAVGADGGEDAPKPRRNTRKPRKDAAPAPSDTPENQSAAE
ncbi:MAG: DUF4167 domain-containing protein [Rhodobacteraceae bacterium]|nr:DUF4167 domain-containing protein [Paracoccaceae bacterium]